MHRRRSIARELARDFAVIVGVWAITAYPIIWTCNRIVGPALFGGNP